MPVTQYMGSSGILMRQLEQTMPGAYAFTLAFAVLIGVLFAYKINKFQENPREIFMYFALLGFMSFILFGNMAAFLGIMLIVGCYWFYVRHQWSKAETVPAGGKAIAESYFPELMSKLEALEKVEKGRSKDKTEAKFEQTVVEEEEMEAALVAAEADLGNKMKSVIESEKQATEKEQELVKALVGYSEGVEKSLGNMNSMTLIDQAGKTVVLNYVQGASGVCRQISDNVQKSVHALGQGIVDIEKDINTMLEATDHASTLSKGVEQIKGKLSKELGKTLIEQVEAKINTMKAELSSLKNKLWQARTAKEDDLVDTIQQEIAVLDQEIRSLEKDLTDLRVMKSQLSSVVDGVGKLAGDIRKGLGVLINAEKKIDRSSRNFVKYLDELKPDALVAASESFSSSVSGLGDGITVAEKVPIEATISVGNIFSEMLKLQRTGLKFFQEDLIRLTDELIVVLQDSLALENSMRQLHAEFSSVNSGYASLKAAARTILGVVDSEDDRSLAELSSDVERVAVTESSKLMQYSQQTLDTLNYCKNSINQIISQLSGNMSYLESSEKQILNILTRALNSIVQNKARVDATFQKQAAQFTAQMSAAQQKVQQARAA